MGGAISWSVKRQSCVALPFSEAEFIALSRTTQEALWWQHLLQQINDEQSIPICCDNQSAICLTRNEGCNPRTKHVSIRYQFVKDVVGKDDIKLHYVPTHEQPADGFTLALAKQKHKQFKMFFPIASFLNKPSLQTLRHLLVKPWWSVAIECVQLAFWSKALILRSKKAQPNVNPVIEFSNICSHFLCVCDRNQGCQSIHYRHRRSVNHQGSELDESSQIVFNLLCNNGFTE